jgi:hypothetical protein
MEKLISKIAIVFLIAALSSCVEFKTISLYDGIEPEPKLPKPETIDRVVEPVIFYDDDSDMWGLEETVCKDASLTNETVYSGNTAVKLSWDRGVQGCEFAGIGIGWDGYAGKDLSQIMDYAAIQFYVRSQEGRMFGLPIVLTLEDYSGGMGFAYTGNKWFERSAIDTEWQKVEVPLSAFDLETENLDVTNIKQLQLELQQAGSIYIDDIKLVFYTPQEVDPWMVEEELPDPLGVPIQLYDDEFINDNGWGLVEDECQTIANTTAEHFSDNKSIYAKWQKADQCKVVGFGVSWNKWKPVDATSKMKELKFQFQVKNAGTPTDKLDVMVGMEDYDRRFAGVQLTSGYVEGGVYNQNWNTVTIPFKDLPKDFDYSSIKQMEVRLKNSGEIYIDDIRLIGNTSD